MAGLWGTMNNEPSDDLMSSSKVKVPDSDIATFARSWALKENCPVGNKIIKSSNTPSKIKTFCESLFLLKVSPFIRCFDRINPEPYLEMCMNSRNEEEACTVSVTYISSCSFENTPLRIPEVCAK